MRLPAIVLRAAGDPDQLRLEDVDVAEPGPGEVQIRHTAIGVNFHDVYVRSGLYHTLALPGIPGIEAAGVVTATEEASFALCARPSFLSWVLSVCFFHEYGDGQIAGVDTHDGS